MENPGKAGSPSIFQEGSIILLWGWALTEVQTKADTQINSRDKEGRPESPNLLFFAGSLGKITAKHHPSYAPFARETHLFSKQGSYDCTCWFDRQGMRKGMTPRKTSVWASLKVVALERLRCPRGKL